MKNIFIYLKTKLPDEATPEDVEGLFQVIALRGFSLDLADAQRDVKALVVEAGVSEDSITEAVIDAKRRTR